MTNRTRRSPAAQALLDQADAAHAEAAQILVATVARIPGARLDVRVPSGPCRALALRLAERAVTDRLGTCDHLGRTTHNPPPGSPADPRSCGACPAPQPSTPRSKAPGRTNGVITAAATPTVGSTPVRSCCHPSCSTCPACSPPPAPSLCTSGCARGATPQQRHDAAESSKVLRPGRLADAASNPGRRRVAGGAMSSVTESLRWSWSFPDQVVKQIAVVHARDVLGGEPSGCQLAGLRENRAAASCSLAACTAAHSSFSTMRDPSNRTHPTFTPEPGSRTQTRTRRHAAPLPPRPPCYLLDDAPVVAASTPLVLIVGSCARCKAEARRAEETA